MPALGHGKDFCLYPESNKANKVFKKGNFMIGFVFGKTALATPENRLAGTEAKEGDGLIGQLL